MTEDGGAVKSGLAGLQALAEEHSDLLTALKVLNTAGHEAGDPPSAADYKHAVAVVHSLASDSETINKTLKTIAKAAEWSARVYTGSTCALQLLGALSAPKAWVRKIPAHEKQPVPLQPKGGASSISLRGAALSL